MSYTIGEGGIGQDPGTRGYRWWNTADFSHSARCAPLEADFFCGGEAFFFVVQTTTSKRGGGGHCRTPGSKLSILSPGANPPPPCPTSETQNRAFQRTHHGPSEGTRHAVRDGDPPNTEGTPGVRGGGGGASGPAPERPPGFCSFHCPHLWGGGGSAQCAPAAHHRQWSVASGESMAVNTEQGNTPPARWDMPERWQRVLDSVGGWQLAAVGGWRLVAVGGGWRLVVPGGGT